MTALPIPAGQPLIGRSRGFFSPEHVLTFGEAEVAVLRYDGWLSGGMVAETADGCWQFRPAGWFSGDVLVTTCDGAEVARYHAPAFSERWLELTTGNRFSVEGPGFMNYAVAVHDAMGAELVRCAPEGFFNVSLKLTVSSTLHGRPELPVLALFAWYQMLRIQHSASSSTSGD